MVSLMIQLLFLKSGSSAFHLLPRAEGRAPGTRGPREVMSSGAGEARKTAGALVVICGEPGAHLQLEL